MEESTNAETGKMPGCLVSVDRILSGVDAAFPLVDFRLPLQLAQTRPSSVAGDKIAKLGPGICPD